MSKEISEFECSKCKSPYFNTEYKCESGHYIKDELDSFSITNKEPRLKCELNNAVQKLERLWDTGKNIDDKYALDTIKQSLFSSKRNGWLDFELNGSKTIINEDGTTERVLGRQELQSKIDRIRTTIGDKTYHPVNGTVNRVKRIIDED